MSKFYSFPIEVSAGASVRGDSLGRQSHLLLFFYQREEASVFEMEWAYWEVRGEFVYLMGSLC